MSFIEDLREQNLKYRTEYTNERIEKNRKGNFTISFDRNEADTPMEISYRLKRIDFDFGCNIFMFDQYDQAEKNQAYLDAWRKLFNTAVVPLYWEGTEPTQGQLRYDADSPNDVYRRPPVDAVVNYCRANQIKMKGHPLFWHEFIPRWLPNDWDTLKILLEKRLQEISSRYADIIPTFDCVNEPSRIWDMCFEHKNDGYKMVVPPQGYVEDVFALAGKYFPENELILNDTVIASFIDFRGVYGGYYQHIRSLLQKGVKIDKIGLQCHTTDSKEFKNVFCAERLYSLLDIYGSLTNDVVISEISIPSKESEEIQANAVEDLYATAFSNPNTSGIFWWNLDDNGILTSKKRAALGENLPSSGIMTNGKPKLAYKTLDRLINEEWTTHGKETVNSDSFTFRGFYGVYEIVVNRQGIETTYEVDLSKDQNTCHHIHEN